MRFVIFRTGWNAANQSAMYSPHTIEVARVTADSADSAVALAATRVTCYNGQFLSAREETEVDAEQDLIDSSVQLTGED